MADSEEENDQELEQEMNLAGFLFGNIDENGQLEDDILDPSAKQHLASLCQLGLGSILQEMMAQDDVPDKKDEEDKDVKTAENGEKPLENGEAADEERDDVDYLAKDPNALDFSDINELAEDCNEEAAALAQNVKTEKEAGYDADDEEAEHKLDAKLMPPPPVPDEKESLTPEEAEAAMKRKLETPLASMLPSKYANVNVTELFPDFRPNKVLRFSKLFGPGKPTSLPQIWRGVRKRRKRKRQQDMKDSDSGSDQENRKPQFRVTF